MKSYKEWKNINECSCGCDSDTCSCGCEEKKNDMEMHLKNLRIIAHYAKSLHEMISSGHELEEWQQHKVSVCRAYLSDVRHAFD